MSSGSGNKGFVFRQRTFHGAERLDKDVFVGRGEAVGFAFGDDLQAVLFGF